MAYRWCPKCVSAVKSEKSNHMPGLMMVIWGLFFMVVPFFGTVIGLPMLTLSILWWFFTPCICAKCESKAIVKHYPAFSPFPKDKVMTKKEISQMFTSDKSTR